MRAFILFLMDWLRQKLDPDYAADLALYQANRELQQELIARESAQLEHDTYKLVQLQCQRDQVEHQLEMVKAEVAELERRREEVRSDRTKKLDDLAGKSADELRTAPL